MELRIVEDSFSAFDPDRDVDAVLSRIHSPKIPLVLKHWLGQRKGSRLPASADIDPAAIKSALPHVMITGISYDPFRVLYRLVGTEIVRWARFEFCARHHFARAAVPRTQRLDLDPPKPRPGGDETLGVAGTGRVEHLCGESMLHDLAAMHDSG
jgi:hypothetical protein